MRIAINGMGRIGRLLCRRLIAMEGMELVAVNDIMDPENLAYLLRYDSVYGTLAEVSPYQNGRLKVGSKEFSVLRQEDPSLLPWKELGVDIVLECTGKFTSRQSAGIHLGAGARRVLLSTTGEPDIPLLIYGFNQHALTPETTVISPGGCMTNCATHVLYLLNSIGIQSAHLNILHSYTSRQELVDAPHKHFRRGRAAAESIIPVEIDLAQSLERLFPVLQHKLATISTRVPVANGALADFTVLLKNKVSSQEINSLFRTSAQHEYKGILEYTEEAMVSLDIKGNIHSCIIDGGLTSVVGDHLKLFAWFDNEYGYTSRMIDWLWYWKKLLFAILLLCNGIASAQGTAGPAKQTARHTQQPGLAQRPGHPQRLHGAPVSAPLAYVDPYIGTGGHGHVFLGVSVPYGAVQVGPTNIVKGWDWCSGYHYSDSILVGFSQMHLSGTGIGDLGDVLIMPYTGKLQTRQGTQKDPGSGYASHYTHRHESANPGYYSVKLEDYGITAELTASERVGFHRYTFPGSKPGTGSGGNSGGMAGGSHGQSGTSKQAHIIIDLQAGIGWDQPMETFIRQKDAYTLEGYRFSKGWAVDQRLWFAIRSSVPLPHFSVYEGDELRSGKELKGIKVKGLLSFDADPGQVMLKVGISPVSSEKALANIAAEIPGWDFAKVVNAADAKWNKELSRISVNTKDEVARRIFYTAFYHTMIDPALFNDHDSAYRGTDKKVYAHPGFNNYSVFSLWDIYRSTAPLSTIVHPDRVNDFVNSMLAIYQQQGKLPVWPLMGNETDCMVGYSAVPVIADAWLKGFRGFDGALAYEAMKASSLRDERGLKYVKERGFIPADMEAESVSKAMEYAVDDAGIAAVAHRLGNVRDEYYYRLRAGYYKNYFDSTIKFVRPKMSDGSWKTPYDPFRSIHENGDFTEGNGWQYTWLVPQDVEGLIGLMGGDEAFTTKLDSLFSASGSMGAEASPDISGLIGMYAHGDEPSHHVTYMYAFAGRQWKTAGKVRQVLREFYTDKPDGLAGNEDCGAMSSWYVLSSMGFYPESPSNGVYVLGSPLFDKVSISLPTGKQFTIETVDNSDKNIYIQRVEWNGQKYDKSYILHKDIMGGGHMKIFMGSTPATGFGQAPADRPRSILD